MKFQLLVLFSAIILQPVFGFCQIADSTALRPVFVVKAFNVSLKSTPAVDGKVITKLGLDAVGTGLKEENGFWLIELSNGSQGWVSSAHLKKLEGAALANIKLANPDSSNKNIVNQESIELLQQIERNTSTTAVNTTILVVIQALSIIAAIILVL